MKYTSINFKFHLEKDSINLGHLHKSIIVSGLNFACPDTLVLHDHRKNDHAKFVVQNWQPKVANSGLQCGCLISLYL